MVSVNIIAKKMTFFIDFADSFENCDGVGSLDRNVQYFKALADSAMEITILSPDQKNYSSLLGDYAKHYPIPTYAKLNRHIFYLLLAPIIFWKILRKCDIYWAKFSSAVPAIIAKKIFSKPLVNFFDYNWVELSQASEESSMEHKTKSMIENLMIRNSDYFITTTETLKTHLIDRGFKYPEHIFIIPNYVDTDLFNPINTMTKEDSGEDIVKIISVGRLSVQKNFPLLMDGLAQLKNKLENKIELTIVGTGPLKEDLLHKAQQLNLELKLIDRISNSGMPLLYREHDIFVMTSPREGHPRALIEAMSCGLPVVGTNVIGIRDVITDGVNGLLCSATPEDIAQKLLRIISDKLFAKGLGIKAREDALQKYSFKALVQQEKNIYKQIISARK